MGDALERTKVGNRNVACAVAHSRVVFHVEITGGIGCDDLTIRLPGQAKRARTHVAGNMQV